jgi:hypothetical protein
MTDELTNQFSYDVVLSFAGEDRQKAEELAEILKQRGVRVFYDQYEQADLWGKDLYEHLADVYTNRARFCVMFLSSHYERKLWTTHERRSAQARAFRERTEYILPLRLDDTEIPGLPATIGYVDLRRASIESVADLLMEKLDESSRPSETSTGAGRSQVSRVIPMPRVKRSFSDLERDRYLRQAFAVVRGYFKDALTQLEGQGMGIQADFLEVNATKYVARLYRNGTRLNECKIWIGSSISRDAISYVEGRFIIDDDSSLNDYLAVMDDGQELQFQLSGFSLGGWRPPKEVITADVAAEYLWRRFISALNR